MQTKWGRTDTQTAGQPSELLSRIEVLVNGSKNDVADWESKQDRFHRIRMRIKKDKNFPFVGSSNLRMPTAEIYIRKAKAAIMNVVFGLRPIIQAIPSPGGSLATASKIEKFYDHLILDVMGFREKGAILIDQALEKGMFLAKPHWCLKIEEREETFNIDELQPEEVQALYTMPTDAIIPLAAQKLDVDLNENVADFNIGALQKAIDKLKTGEKKVTFTVKDIIYNAPDVAMVSPDRCYVPSYAGYDPQGLEWIVHEYLMPLDAVERNAKYKGWSINGLEKIKDTLRSASSDDKQIDLTKDTREGISVYDRSGLVKIREFYGYEDIGSGKKEKVCITYAPDFKTEFRKIKWTPYSGKFPFVKFFYELSDDRWFSHRGIPEMLEDIIKEIDTQHNMKIDQQTIRNAPMFVYRSGMVNPNMVQMRPNQGIPVKGTMALGDAIQALNFHNPNVEFSYEKEQQILEAKISELLGQADYTLQSMINRRQPRTLGEVEMQASSYQSVAALDASMFVESFSRLFNMVLELWSMYGPDEYQFNYFGRDGQMESVKLSKEEIQNKYTITVRGNDTNANPNVRIQKAQQVLMGVTNPLLIQTGVVTPAQMIEGLRRFYQALDIENYDTLINPNPQPTTPPPDPIQRFGKVFKDMTNDEQAQVLQAAGIEPDLDNRSDKYERETAHDEADLLGKMVNTLGS
jgi:hypothetical protein